uniref:LEM domain containing 1 n=1 Tax=Tetraodon nigroviridis TaxID=99883 RepID=H3D4T1_TETNG
MPLLEDPARLSKSRLKSDLLAHNMALPPANSRKEVYVELHLKHIEQRNAAEFSSDEEDQAQDEPDKVEDADDPEIPDPSALTDDDLKTALLRHGVKVGPIVASTRAVYEKKLRRLLQPGAGDEQANGEEENAVLYSDSEDEDESEGDEEETVEQSQQEMSQRVPTSETRKPPPVKPVNGVSKDIFPSQASPTGIYATRRRPIKGAAGRPVQYVSPNTPTSPASLQRREVERQLVPIHIQIKVFLVVVVLLYLIYVAVEESSLESVMSLLESPNQASDMEFYAQETMA